MSRSVGKCTKHLPGRSEGILNSIVCYIFFSLCAHVQNTRHYHRLCVLANFTLLNFYNLSTFKIVFTDDPW